MNLIAFVSPSGRDIRGAWRDRNGAQREESSGAMKAFLSPGSPLLNLSAPRSGLILHPDGPMFVASAPLKTAGVVVVGRLLDPEPLKDTAHFKDLSVDMEPFDGTSLPADFKDVQKRYMTDPEDLLIPLSKKVIGAYTVLRDIADKPVLILRVSSNRNVYLQWLDTIRYFILWFALVALVGALIINALFDRLVLTKQKGKESEERFKSVLKQASEGIVIVDLKDKRILEGNAAF